MKNIQEVEEMIEVSEVANGSTTEVKVAAAKEVKEVVVDDGDDIPPSSEVEEKKEVVMVASKENPLETDSVEKNNIGVVFKEEEEDVSNVPPPPQMDRHESMEQEAALRLSQLQPQKQVRNQSDGLPQIPQKQRQHSNVVENNSGGALLPDDEMEISNEKKKDSDSAMELESSISFSQLQKEQQQQSIGDFDSFETENNTAKNFSSSFQQSQKSSPAGSSGKEMDTINENNDKNENDQNNDDGDGDDDDDDLIQPSLSTSSRRSRFNRESLGKSIPNIDIDYTVQEIEKKLSSPKGKGMGRSISVRFTKVAKAIHLLKDRKKKRVDETHKHYLTAHCIRDGIKYVTTNTPNTSSYTTTAPLNSKRGTNISKINKNKEITQDSFHQVQRFTLPMTIAASAKQQQGALRRPSTIEEDATTTTPAASHSPSPFFSSSFGSSMTSLSSANSIAKGHFEFKEYAPFIFLKLRQHWGVSQEDYMQSLVSEDLYLDFQSNSKSGQFFFFSDDKFFLIKTLTPQEVRWFSDALQTYYNQFMEYPESLLVKFMGLYRIKMPANATSRKLRKIHFVVMRSTFDTILPMHKKFDLKGSHVGREASESDKKKLFPVLKDKDLEKSGLKIYLGRDKSKFLKQLDADCTLLSNLNMMDYSLLIGIFDKKWIDPKHGIDDTTIREILRQDHCLHYIDRLDDHGVIYFVGIIDFLQHYNARKRMETFSKSIVNDSTEISSVPPGWYSKRLVSFIKKFVV